jgi:hypothetical protein
LARTEQNPPINHEEIKKHEEDIQKITTNTTTNLITELTQYPEAESHEAAVYHGENRIPIKHLKSKI